MSETQLTATNGGAATCLDIRQGPHCLTVRLIMHADRTSVVESTRRRTYARMCIDTYVARIPNHEMFGHLSYRGCLPAEYGDQSDLHCAPGSSLKYARAQFSRR